MAGSLTKWTGIQLASTDLNGIHNFILTNMLAYAMDGATTTNQDNLKLDLFTSDTSQSLQHLTYNSTNDNYETTDQSVWSGYYVDIYTTSTTGISALAINNCQTQLVSYDGSTYVYRMYSTSVGAEVQRAEVMETLFLGNTGLSGTDARVTGITGLTNLKSSDSRDVGKRAYIYRIDYTDAGGGLGGGATESTYDITFNNTSTNTSCSIWSTAGGMKNGTSPWYSGVIEFPDGTNINSASSSRSDEFGTDRSADELDNPADMQIRSVPFAGGTSYGGAFSTNGPNCALILCVGTTSGTYTDGSDPAWQEGATIDFKTTHSIPDFEAATLSSTDAVLVTGTATLASEDTAILKTFYTVDAANTLTIEFSANGGTNYQTITEEELFTITNTGVSGQVRFTITRTDNTTTDTLDGYAYYYG